MIIEIKHQIEKTFFKFEVENCKKLLKEEVELICDKMGMNFVTHI